MCCSWRLAPPFCPTLVCFAKQDEDDFFQAVMASPGHPAPPHVTIPQDVAANNEDAASSISTSLHRLSINPPQASRHRSPSPMARTASNSQNASPRASRPGTRNGPAGSASRVPDSPSSARKTSSPLVARRDSHGAPSSPALRRKSSNFSMRSSSQTRAPPSPVFEQPPVTAASLAADHFKAELLHHNTYLPEGPDTIVIVHDACYGHRFSRPKVSKSGLSLIVERPERLQAGALGLSSAYVRLGERHADGANPIRPKQEPNPRIPLRILKSTRSTPIVAPVVANVHGAKWTQELKQMADAAEARLQAGGKELQRPETPTGNANKPHLHEGDLYLCKDSLDAFQGAIGGVLDGVDTVFGATASGRDTTKAFVCVRPPGHHCSSDHPSGFCWLNNVHIGIEHAALAHGLTHAAIIDFDLHHGDGSQAIAWERNAKAAKAPKNAPLSKKTSIGYYSLHDINSYPCEWGDLEKVQSASLCIENAHSQSIWNVHLQPWKSEEEFWALYESRYLVLLDKARAFLRHHTQRLRSSTGNVQPKAAIFISAGFDASEHEGEGMQRHKVNVPTAFYARFTSDIVKLANEEGTAVDGRVVSVLEGGYSDRALMSGVLSHLVGLTQTTKVHSSPLFDTNWWSMESLSELERLLQPDRQLPIQVKKRPGEQGNYASPTQSFSAKVVDPEKMYRSVSGTMRSVAPSRPPTPPAPDVDWATAAHELGKLLIPTDRPVVSCRHDELNEPKPKKERHSSIGVPAMEAPTERVTRGRRAKGENRVSGPATASKGHDVGRRRTISDLPAPPETADFDQVVPSIEPSTRPSTSAGSPTKTAFGGDNSSTTSRRSSLSRRSSPPRNAAAASAQVKPRRTSGAGMGAAKGPNTSREQSQMSIKEETPPSSLNDSSSRPVPANNNPASAPSIDQLASRVKKITLHPPKVPAVTEAAKLKPAAAKPVRKTPTARTSKAATSTAASKAAAARPAAAASAKTTKSADQPISVPASHAPATGTSLTSNNVLSGPTIPAAQSSSQPAEKQAAPFVNPPSPRGHEDPFQSTPSAAPLSSSKVTTPPPASVVAAPGYDPLFIPYNPPGQPESSGQTNVSSETTRADSQQQQQLTWMAPHTTAQGAPPPPTPAAPRARAAVNVTAAAKENLPPKPPSQAPPQPQKQNLYVGNALGPIPFSPRKSGTGIPVAAAPSAPSAAASQLQSAIPRREDLVTQSTPRTVGDFEPLSASDPAAPVPVASQPDTQGLDTNGSSIWDVPRTPAPRADES